MVSSLLCARVVLLAALPIRLAIKGVNVSAINREANNVSTTVTGMARIKVPEPFCINNIGKNDSTVVSVPLATAQATCELPLIAASLALSPSRKCRATFSTTTMALSTNKPSAITRPTIDICCNPKPDKSTQPMAIKIDNGIAVTTTSAGFNPSTIKDKTATRIRP